MKFWMTFLVFICPRVLASADLMSTYLDFENSYMSNSVEAYEPWLAKDYKIIQTLHIPELGSDSREVTGKQMLAAMKSMKVANSTPRSTPENTEINLVSDNDFCATSTTVSQTKVGGKDYEEKEVRKVCFTKKLENYLAISHKIDVYYSEI